MEKRINSKQFIDMDELSCPWESGNKLVTPINDAKQSKYESIIEIIKNAKYEYILDLVL